MPMIRSGRCDNCRRIKRKCDEAKPTCSGCLDRKVECQYSVEISKFVSYAVTKAAESDSADSLPKLNAQGDTTVVLRLRSTRQPPSGSGTYYTFVPFPPTSGKARRKSNYGLTQKDPSTSTIHNLPMSETTRLASEYVSVLQSADHPGLHMRLWGRWLEYIPSRLGHDSLLDTAVACLVAGHDARHSAERSQALQKGRHQYGKALTALRERLSPGKVTVDTIAATKVLMVFELIAGAEVVGWLSHAYGAIDLFLAAGPAVCETDFGRALFYSTCAQAWLQGLTTGKASVYDRPEWLQMAPEPCAPLNLDRHQQRGPQIFTRIPRLIQLVREVRSSPNDDVIAAKAVSLAQSLLAHVWNDSVTRRCSKTAPTWDPADAVLVPLSFELSTEEFEGAVSYALHWAFKIMLSGLCQALQASGAPLPVPDVQCLRSEEQMCARLICMMVQSASQLLPYGAAPILMPMQIAWGALWREQRSCDPLPAAQPRALMDWLKTKGNYLMQDMVSVPMREKGLISLTERLEGCPIPPGSIFEQNVPSESDPR